MVGVVLAGVVPAGVVLNRVALARVVIAIAQLPQVGSILPLLFLAGGAPCAAPSVAAC